MNLRRWLAAACAALLATGCASTPEPAQDLAAISALSQESTDRLIVVAIANPAPATLPQAGSTLPLYAASQRYAVGSAARETVRALERAHGLTERVGWPIRVLGLHCVVLEIRPDRSRDAVLAALARDKRVEIAQPLGSFDTLAGTPAEPYNDPYAKLQRGFVEIDAVQAHRISRGTGVLIAVIDTGADTAHPDLQGRVGLTRNFVDGDAGAFRRDRHGTQVAGVIAAVADNHLGIVGVAPDARLALYKACWQLPSTPTAARCNTLTLALALSAAIDDGAGIINLSLGGPPDELLARLLAQAIKQGRIVIGAVPPSGAAGFPASVDGVIAVDVRGRTQGTREALRAPGTDILTLQPGGSYDYESGSSLAAAHVSGAAALLLGAAPRLTSANVRTLLARSQGPSTLGESINACSALTELPGAAVCTSRRP